MSKIEIYHLVHPAPWSVSISQSSSCSSRGILPSEEAASGRWGYKKKWGKLTFKCVDSFAATKDRQGFLFIKLVLISIFTVNILKKGAVESKRNPSNERDYTWNWDPARSECPGARWPVLPRPDSGEWEDLHRQRSQVIFDSRFETELIKVREAIEKYVKL